jgi:hypothetical protein
MRIRAKMAKREKDSPMSPRTGIAAPPLASLATSTATGGAPGTHVMVEEGSAPVMRVKMFANWLTGIEPVAARNAAEGLLFTPGLKVPRAATHSPSRPARHPRRRHQDRNEVSGMPRQCEELRRCERDVRRGCLHQRVGTHLLC